MLQNKKENGVMSMLHEILAVDGEGEEGASSSKTSRKGPPPKLRGGATAACIALIEMISCWTEGMSVWLLSSAALLRVSDVVWVRGRQCFLEEGGIPEAAMCAMFRDAGLIAAGFLSIACMAAALSLRYHIFFALPTIKLMRGIFRPETPDVESSKHHRKRGISGTTLTTCLLMALGMVFQVWGQRAAGRSLFSSANFKERGGGYSASRTLDLILFAPVREEVLHRYFILHVARNRAGPGCSVAMGGAMFGLVHLFNAWGERYSASYVYVQVLQAWLIGSFLSSRMLIRGPINGIVEPCVIHVINNLFSSALPSTTVLDVGDWFVATSLAMTVCVFGGLLYRDLVKLGKMPS